MGPVPFYPAHCWGGGRKTERRKMAYKLHEITKSIGNSVTFPPYVRIRISI